MEGYRDPYTEYIDSIRDWIEFLDVLDAWWDITARFRDVEDYAGFCHLLPEVGRDGWWTKILASWILDGGSKRRKPSRKPLLAITRMIQAYPVRGNDKDSLTPNEIERCCLQWRPYQQILIEQAEGKTPPAAEVISVDLARQTVTFNGKPFDVASVQSLRSVKVLAEHPGTWITGPELVRYDPELDGVRTDKLRKNLPANICDIIESETSRGSRLSLGVTMP